MSQFSGQKRGNEIEEHLSSIHLEPWFSRIKMSEEDYKNNEYEVTSCLYCDNILEKPYWEIKYNGIRGKCRDCDVIWNLT